MNFCSCLQHPFTYINPVNQKRQYLTYKQQNTILVATLIFGILTAGFALLPVLYGLSAFYRSRTIQQIQNSHNSTVAKTDQQTQKIFTSSQSSLVACGESSEEEVESDFYSSSYSVSNSSEKISALKLVRASGQQFPLGFFLV